MQEDEWEAFAAIWKPFEIKRKELLTAKGETEQHLFFITEGIQRVFSLDEKNREATLVFTYPYSFGGSITSLLLQTPSPFYYESLTPSRGLKTSYQELSKLMNQYPSIERLIRIGISAAFAGVLDRMVELQTYTSEEKLKALLNRSPHILNLIPHKYIANYLSIDPTNFSKLLNQVRL